MEHWLEKQLVALPWIPLFLLILLTLYTLSKGADILVDEVVRLSERWGVPKILIGATIVSLGTTTPEVAVSVLAAAQGSAELALGNAVGSILCDTGLILGLSALIAPLPLDRAIVNRQGWIQLGAGALLVLGCLPVGALGSVFQTGGRLSQPMGFVFLVLLVLYLWQAVRWTRAGHYVVVPDDIDPSQAPGTGRIVLRFILGLGLVVGSSWVLIPAVREAALRLYIPQSVIAATLVAFGTSLPELVTSVTAAQRGHGEIAVGNIIGADILNVLFVAGASASVTAGGLVATPYFFRFLFPAMMAVLLVFRIGITLSGTTMRRPFGIVLIAIYVAVLVLSYLLPSSS